MSYFFSVLFLGSSNIFDFSLLRRHFFVVFCQFLDALPSSAPVPIISLRISWAFHQSSARHGDRLPSQCRKTTSLFSFPVCMPVPEALCPYTVALEARLSDDQSCSGTTPGKNELSQSVEPCGEGSLSPACSIVRKSKCSACSGPVSGGLTFSLTYKEKADGQASRSQEAAPADGHAQAN